MCDRRIGAAVLGVSMVDAVQQRVSMVDSQVRPSDVTDRRIIRAMLQVPRENFVPAGREALAYADNDVPVASGRALLAPRTFAKLVQLADVGDRDRVLVVGCGTGYGAAVLQIMGAEVTALEADAGLLSTAKEQTERCANGVRVVQGPLSEGWASNAPYDAILVEGAVAATPDALLSQLKDGGRLVAVLSAANGGRAILWRRSGQVYGETFGFDAAAGLLPGFARAPAFAL